MSNKIVLTAVSAMILVAPLFAQAALLTQTLDLGESGPSVTSLQMFLSTDATIYPSKLVTGYFGQLTKAAVERFQTQNNIISNGTPETTGYGRVGPVTLAAINAQMGGGNVGGDVYAPMVSNLTLSRGANNATFTWDSNEPAVGKVHYQTSFLSMTEGSATSPAFVGGTVASEGTYSTSHSVTLTGLQSGTIYYYVVESVDAKGNQMIVWPTTFSTTN